MKKVIILVVVALLTFANLAFFGNNEPPSKELKSKMITQLTMMLMNRQCYRSFPIDDNLSEKIFNKCFESLDPAKIFFSKEDIEEFIGFKYYLDNMLMKGDAEFAILLHSKFLERLKEYKNYCFSEIEKGFDFTKDEKYIIDREDIERSKDLIALKKIWRKKLKNDILKLRLMEKIKEEDAKKEMKKKKEEKEKTISAENKEKQIAQEKEEKKNEKIKKLWDTKTPVEKLKKRMEDAIINFESKDDLKVLEVFLSVFTNIFDPHSVYMSPDEEEDFDINMGLSLIGIGAVLSTVDGYVKVNKIIVGGPADKAGDLKAEDRIIAVSEEGEEPVSVIDMPISKVVRYIRGKKGAVVELTILDGDKGMSALPEIIKVKRDKVDLNQQAASKSIEIIKSDKGTYKIGIITLKSFYRDFKSSDIKNRRSTTTDVKRILDEFEEENVQGVVMDLRNNGGGSLREAVDLTGLFIKSGPVVQVKDSNDRIDVLEDEDELTYYDIPLAVMVNKFSASATEIFAGAIQDYQRGVIIGDEHTHGKGTVQTVYPLDSLISKMFRSDFKAGVVKFTTSMFYRITGSSTQLKGVTPDIIFPSYSDVMDLGEIQIKNALKWDKIKEASHDSYGKLTPILAKLNVNSKNRQIESPLFKKMLKGIELYKTIQDKKEISLNEEKRWNEYKKESKIIEEQMNLLKFEEESESEADKKKNKKHDLYLKESLNIMIDFIKLKTS